MVKFPESPLTSLSDLHRKDEDDDAAIDSVGRRSAALHVRAGDGVAVRCTVHDQAGRVSLPASRARPQAEARAAEAPRAGRFPVQRPRGHRTPIYYKKKKEEEVLMIAMAVADASAVAFE